MFIYYRDAERLLNYFGRVTGAKPSFLRDTTAMPSGCLAVQTVRATPPKRGHTGLKPERVSVESSRND